MSFINIIIIIIISPIKQHFIWADSVHSDKYFQGESFQLHISNLLTVYMKM